ncbi:hypothetical protein CONPUDRAFT_83743 [Coniophora puteana RWD-64-598 SS2]|uniref:Uncharacterized protein n=1 Tax=Coniophora puteana (strain RWD-64-598) TaxID=741705 RepID=A0A5M3MG86_CONPW|nr:uncharacterized protein CONPUDRAFT_83743 [Coniophora puteana RWD-64-598 SS2]EIW78259.1 hypothetical protein CONPUDRAFT_83743 [Coniophora puteana RWD-64-598 SS2]
MSQLETSFAALNDDEKRIMERLQKLTGSSDSESLVVLQKSVDTLQSLDSKLTILLEENRQLQKEQDELEDQHKRLAALVRSRQAEMAARAGQ